MVKKLRNKFVIVTTTLMIVVFGSFLIITTIYNNYWNDIELIDMLDWIASSGIFTVQEENTSNEELVKDLTENDSPIIGIILDKNFNILKKQVIGSGKDIQVPDEVLNQMCNYKYNAFKIDKYYYSYSELDEDQILLVVMDSSVNEHSILKILGVIGLITGGVLLLILVTMFLSRFVTRPAEQLLLREKRFISDASHELKTPLGAISINAQALQVEGMDNLYVSNIISEAGRMNRLIERLLILSKLDEAPEVPLEDINLSDLCEEMALTYESVAFERKIKFDYEIDKNMLMKGNSDDIRQLMAILIDNAIKNTPELGIVHVKCTVERKYKDILVSNTGKGISKEDLPHVFERFYTSDTSRKNNSFGLGLAIAKAIVEKHKGNIEVESVPDQETVFKIRF